MVAIMAKYNTFTYSHAQVATSDNFFINLGSAGQILTGLIFSATPGKTDGLQLLMVNSVDETGSGGEVIAGYTNSTPLNQPVIFNLVPENQYIKLSNPYLYFTSTTSMGSPAGETQVYITTMELNADQNINSNINTLTVPVTVDTRTTILTAPVPGDVYNVKSVYVYQDDVLPNSCQLFVNDILVSQEISLSNNDTVLMNPNSQIVLQEGQPLQLQVDNAVTSVYAIITWTVSST